MSTTSIMTTTVATTIQIATINMTYYGSITILLIGIIGCLCNFITFTAPQLRKNSCSFYFLVAALFELFSIIFGLISRMASENLGSTLLSTSHVYCKVRAYLVTALPLIATYHILLSSLDRYFSSSTHVGLRSLSQMKIAYRASIFMILLSFASCSHILILYDLRPRCSTMPGAYATFDGLFVVVWLGVIPHALMLLFGSLTFLNIRRQKRRVITRTNNNHAVVLTLHQQREQKREKQLIIMMFVQVGISSFLILTRMIYYAYYILAPPLTGYNRLVGSFLMSFTILLYYANYAKSFYIYTLSSHLFRSIFIHRLKFCVEKLLFRNKININLKNATRSLRTTGHTIPGQRQE